MSNMMIKYLPSDHIFIALATLAKMQHIALKTGVMCY